MEYFLTVNRHFYLNLVIVTLVRHYFLICASLSKGTISLLAFLNLVKLLSSMLFKIICDIKGNLLPSSSMVETTCKTGVLQYFVLNQLEVSNVSQFNVLDDKKIITFLWTILSILDSLYLAGRRSISKQSDCSTLHLTF